jgi:hypothetical protein
MLRYTQLTIILALVAVSSHVTVKAMQNEINRKVNIHEHP